MSNDGWTPGRWWRVAYADGRVYPLDHPRLAGRRQIWCETSDEAEAREALTTCPGGGVLSRLYEHRSSEWRVEP